MAAATADFILSGLAFIRQCCAWESEFFIGAVWANVSWGSYWAWDPKEVWALISFLIYGAAFHGPSLAVFRQPRFFHAYMVLAFLTVLMTYFGVNYLLGGMHSYVLIIFLFLDDIIKNACGIRLCTQRERPVRVFRVGAGRLPPRISVTVPEEVSQQEDLLVARSSELGGNSNTAVALTFNHALTAVRFVCGNDMREGTVKQVRLKKRLFQRNLQYGDTNLERFGYSRLLLTGIG